jgi:DNA-binding LacI/PurR family transcriptional regulator
MEQDSYKHITQKEVATKAGVSLSAVSRTFTEGASVSLSTKKKVMEAANILGYKPNILAQSLMTNRTRLIGLVNSNFENPFIIQVFDLITRELQARNYRSLFENLTEKCDPEEVLERLLQYRVDGVLFISSVLPTAFAEVCTKAKLPSAIMFGRGAENGLINTITADNYGGAEIGAKLLLSSNYKNIAFLGGPKNASTTIDRKQSLINTLKKNGQNLLVTKHCKVYSYDEGRKESLELLQQYPEIDAIFCGDDILAFAAIDSAKELGRKCPDDIGILGFNDMPMASWASYNLTTINQPIQQMVSAAIEIIMAQIENPQRGIETRILPCKLIERGTLKTQKSTS